MNKVKRVQTAEIMYMEKPPRWPSFLARWADASRSVLAALWAGCRCAARVLMSIRLTCAAALVG